MTITTTFILTGLLLGLGAAALIVANHIAWKMARVPDGPVKNARRMQLLGHAFRFFVGGLGLVGVAMGWLHDLDWLVTLSLVFALEELYEGTAIVGIMKRAERDTLRSLPDHAHVATTAPTPPRERPKRIILHGKPLPVAPLGATPAPR